jgi:GR25 family glycosyltransferase involved in LPS biosynthesis
VAEAKPKLYAISLEPAGARYRAFAESNRHLGEIDIFKAIKGADIPLAERVSSGLITPELLAPGAITEGTLGCAASHRAVWRKIAAAGEGAGKSEGALVMEDDVVTHPRLLEFFTRHADFMRHADLVFFAVNTDSVLATVSREGLASYEFMMPQFPDLAWIRAALAATVFAEVRAARMLNGFGLCCYWLSASAAARLLDLCYPLTLEGTAIPFMAKPWPGSAIDGRMNAFFASLRVYVTRPFLAYSPNTDSSTSV